VNSTAMFFFSPLPENGTAAALEVKNVLLSPPLPWTKAAAFVVDQERLSTPLFPPFCGGGGGRFPFACGLRKSWRLSLLAVAWAVPRCGCHLFPLFLFLFFFGPTLPTEILDIVLPFFPPSPFPPPAGRAPKETTVAFPPLLKRMVRAFLLLSLPWPEMAVEAVFLFPLFFFFFPRVETLRGHHLIDARCFSSLFSPPPPFPPERGWGGGFFFFLLSFHRVTFL